METWEASIIVWQRFNEIKIRTSEIKLMQPQVLTHNVICIFFKYNLLLTKKYSLYDTVSEFLLVYLRIQSRQNPFEAIFDSDGRYLHSERGKTVKLLYSIP